MRSFDLNIFTGVLWLLYMVHCVASGAVFIEPYAKICQFGATVIVPRQPTVLQSTGVQAFWPALEPANSLAILQIPITNEGPHLGQWSFFEFFQEGTAATGGNPIHGDNIDVYPGDLLGNGFFSVNDSESGSGPSTTNSWYVSWVVNRTEDSRRNGAVDLISGAKVDLANYPDVGNFTQAVLATEVSRAAKWEMGPLTWSNISIQIESKETSWCSIDKLLLRNVTLSDVKPVHIYPSLTGMICYFEGFTVTDVEG